jgi:hypothetical protein
VVEGVLLCWLCEGVGRVVSRFCAKGMGCAGRQGGKQKKVPASIALDVGIHIERVKHAQLQLPVQWSGASTRRLENSISRYLSYSTRIFLS